MILPLATSLELFFPFTPCHSCDFSLCPTPICKHAHASHPLTTSDVASPADMGSDLFLHQQALQTIFISSASLGFSTFCHLASATRHPANPALSKAGMMPASRSWAHSLSSSLLSHVTPPVSCLPPASFLPSLVHS